ncbi:MAG TPA: hypothetical protein VFU05_12850 [Cyclobacteriaceae bacterium]|nr:hypothetical protein [Cyclobacteriaceae bacterium]
MKFQPVFFLAVALSFGVSNLTAQQTPLIVKNLETMNVKLEAVKYKGKNAIRVTGTAEGEQLAILKNSNFKNGTIEIEVSGQPLPSANAGARGFIGLAFRLRQTDSVRYECFYIRPTNGRAEDQLRRNHCTQYISHPGYPWFKLRNENPGVYESYVDLVAGEWTKLKIVVQDKEARLYVHDADQPCLIVKDMKQELSEGAIALWIDSGTDAYFTNLKIQKKD